MYFYQRHNMDYRGGLQRALDKINEESLKGKTIIKIKGKPFLYSNRKYIGPASPEQIQALNQRDQVRLIKWAIKYHDRILAAAKLMSTLPK